jgi:biopolymer transport protein ExbB/TolQ
MAHTLDGAMYSLGQLFLMPVLLAIAILFAYAFFALGAFAWQAWQRRRGTQDGFELVAAWKAMPQLSANELEMMALERLEFARIATRVAPMLGLVATMILMAPALRALGDGKLAEVSRSLTVAFSAVILALIAASITYTVLNVRRRWYVRDLGEIDKFRES